MALTERQQQIQDLLEQGKSAKEIAEALGITTNGVYQQLRRMRAGGASAKPAKRAKTAKAKPAKAQPTAKPPGVNESTAPPRVMTPLQAIRARRDELAAGLRDAEAEVSAAQRNLESVTVRRDKIAERIGPELESLAMAERAMKGETLTSVGVITEAPESAVTPDPPVEAAAEAKPAKAANAKPKPAKAPAKAAAQTPQPGSQAEREATADPFTEGDEAAKAEAEAADAAAEAAAA